MNLNISCRHFDRTPSIEEKIKEKAEHLKKYFHGNIDIHWVCSADNGLHRSEVNVHAGQSHFHAHAEDDSLYKTMDEVLAKLDRQIQKKNNQLKDKIHTHHTRSVVDHSVIE